MNQRLLTIAAQIIGKVDREHTADSVLRAELKKAAGISRVEGGLISRAIFSYYRWLAWLDDAAPIAERLRRADELNESFKTYSNSVSDVELKQAVPAWVGQHMKASPQWLRFLQQEPMLWLRAKLGTGRKVAGHLGKCWVPGEEFLKDVVCYEGGEDLFQTAEFHAGEFELQDISSQIVGLLCSPKPGETWWDACAGEGGKTLHLCDLMQNKGLVWASDRTEWRLKKLKRRMARAGLFNYRSVLWSNPVKPPVKTKFDGILVDAPCSGIGVWQRNPQARWTTMPEDVLELAEVQKQLLATAVGALKPGGKLIYSVCTLSDSETKEVTDAITRRFPELQPLGFANPMKANDPPVHQLTLWPQEVNGNGMFICGWQKPCAQPA